MTESPETPFSDPAPSEEPGAPETPETPEEGGGEGGEEGGGDEE